MTLELPVRDAGYLTLVGGEPLVFHCHHYNSVLQQTVLDAAQQVPLVVDLLQTGATLVAHHQLASAMAGASSADRLALVADNFRARGFGLLDLGGVSADGGRVTVTNSHYAIGCRSRDGELAKPTCYFAAGYLEGALAAAFDLPAGSLHARETSCAAMSADGRTCEIVLERRAEPLELPEAVGGGEIPGSWPPRPAAPASGIDEEAIRAAVATLPLGGNEEGLIPGFGVYLTHHYANYYNFLSYETERHLSSLGPETEELVRRLFVEAGHVCAFHTFGGIMISPEWEAVVMPMIRAKRDWIPGVLAIVNALGWGRFSVEELVEDERLVVRVDGGYEANYYLARYGTGERTRCYLCQGGVAGLMNLLYVGDVTKKPTLDTAYYDQLFSGARSFRAQETHCRCKGDDYCRFVAEPARFD